MALKKCPKMDPKVQARWKSTSLATWGLLLVNGHSAYAFCLFIIIKMRNFREGWCLGRTVLVVVGRQDKVQEENSKVNYYISSKESKQSL